VTNFISLSNAIDLSRSSQIILQLVLALPLLIVMPCLGYIAKIGALLSGIGELNLLVIKSVLERSMEVETLQNNLRTHILAAIESLHGAGLTSSTARDVVLQLFAEIDQDGSGEIDKIEFRFMLRSLKLKFSDERFHLLYTSLATSERSCITRKMLETVLFGSEPQTADVLKPAARAGRDTKQPEDDDSVDEEEEEGGSNNHCRHDDADDADDAVSMRLSAPASGADENPEGGSFSTASFTASANYSKLQYSVNSVSPHTDKSIYGTNESLNETRVVEQTQLKQLEDIV
jgi:hypothetical protein